MTHLRRALALTGAAALAVALVPAAAQANDTDKVYAPVPTDGPALAIADGDRNWLAPNRESLISEFFAGHVYNTDDAVELNTAEFEIHDWECGSEDDGVGSSVISYDADGFFNGGPIVFMFCSEGEKTYDPGFLDAAFTPIDQPVAAGDRVIMSIDRDAEALSATYTMENTTQGWTETYESTVFGEFPDASVEIGDAAITLDGVTSLPPPAFGRDSVKNVQFDGLALSDSGSQKVQRVEEGTTTIIERATKWRAALDDERFSLINKT